MELTPRAALSRIPAEIPVRVVYCLKRGRWAHCDRVDYEDRSARDLRSPGSGLWGDAYQDARRVVRRALWRSTGFGAVVLVHPDGSLRAVEATRCRFEMVKWRGTEGRREAPPADPEWCWTATGVAETPRSGSHRGREV